MTTLISRDNKFVNLTFRDPFLEHFISRDTDQIPPLRASEKYWPGEKLTGEHHEYLTIFMLINYKLFNIMNMACLLFNLSIIVNSHFSLNYIQLGLSIIHTYVTYMEWENIYFDHVEILLPSAI